MKNKKKTRKLLLLLVLVIAISVGFALLSTTLFINGTSTIKGNKWDIRWDSDSVAVTKGSVAAEDPEVTENDTKVSFEVELELPGDFYEFTIDAINAGTVDGMISDIVTTVKDGTGETATLPEYIHFSVTYADGDPIAKNHLLAKRVDATHPTRETYKVRLEYDEEETTVPANDLTYTITYDVTYDQANANAVDRNANSITYINRQVEGQITPGDIIGIGETEDFYVISSNSSKTILLAKNNLLVGLWPGDEILDSENTPGYGLQNEEAVGYTGGLTWATVEFSSTNYWIGGNGEDGYILTTPYNENNTIYLGTSDENDWDLVFRNRSDNSIVYPYVYDENSTIYQYISGENGYVNKLKAMGAPSTITGRLLSYEEADAAKEIGRVDVEEQGYYTSIIFNETKYWLGSSDSDDDILRVLETSIGNDDGNYSLNDWYGIRPVIEIPTRELQ